MNHRKGLSTEAFTERTDADASTVSAFQNKNLNWEEDLILYFTFFIYLQIVILSNLQTFVRLHKQNLLRDELTDCSRVATKASY